MTQRELLTELSYCSPTFDDKRLDYVEVQIDRNTWEELILWSAENHVGEES